MVTRQAGVPAVVSVQGLRIGAAGIDLGGRRIPAGTPLVVDGTRGAVLLPGPDRR